jgi:hypothetical protein
LKKENVSGIKKKIEKIEKKPFDDIFKVDEEDLMDML